MQYTDQPLDYHNDYLLKTTAQLRFRLEAHNIPHFHLEITASGDTDDVGSTLIEFKLSKHGYTDVVRGNELHAVVEEFIRRFGWQKAYDAQLLPNRSRSEEAELESNYSEKVPF